MALTPYKMFLLFVLAFAAILGLSAYSSALKVLLLLEGLGLIIIASISSLFSESIPTVYFVSLTLLVCGASVGLGTLISLSRNTQSNIIS